MPQASAPSVTEQGYAKLDAALNQGEANRGLQSEDEQSHGHSRRGAHAFYPPATANEQTCKRQKKQYDPHLPGPWMIRTGAC